MSEIIPASSPISLSQLAANQDILAEVLADKRSPETRRAYAKDLKDFFATIAESEPTPAKVAEFLQLSKYEARVLVLRYKQGLIEKGLKEATVNRRLAAIKSLVTYAYQIGKCNYSLAEVKGEKVKAYRDTTGISPEAFKGMLGLCDRGTLSGKRDYAILRLLWDNALRRGEVSRLDIKDFEWDSRRLWILGKGRGSQKEAVKLPVPTVQALQDWLQARRESNVNLPMFVSFDPVTPGHRLTGTAIYKIVQAYAVRAGISKKLSPHRIRHSSVTAALEATNGDVRRVQKLSRHVNLNTLTVYDDNRLSHQGEISDLLADLV